MRILHIVLNLKFGGLEKLAIDLSNKLNAGSAQSIICCLEDGGELISEAKSRDIEVISFGKKPGINFLLPFKISRFLKERNISIVHCHNHGAMFYGTIAGCLANVAVITTIHGREKKISNNPLWSLLWLLNRKIIFISEDAKKQFLLYARHVSRKAKVIYNGTDLSRFSSNNTDKDAKEPAKQIIGTVSRLAKEKDQKALINALLIIRQKGLDATLIFTGDGPMKGVLSMYARQTGMIGYVQFSGFQEDIQAILKKLNIFVLSSLTEGVSISLLEAMASGLPVVVTNVGGNPEVVIDGETGSLVPPKEPQKMADAIIKILKDPKLAQKMGEAGRRRVEEKFSLDRMVKEYQDLYELCLYKKGFKTKL